MKMQVDFLAGFADPTIGLLQRRSNILSSQIWEGYLLGQKCPLNGKRGCSPALNAILFFWPWLHVNLLCVQRLMAFTGNEKSRICPMT